MLKNGNNSASHPAELLPLNMLCSLYSLRLLGLLSCHTMSTNANNSISG